MRGNAVIQVVFYFVVLIGLIKPLGAYMARVFEGEALWAQRAFSWLERLIYRLCGISDDENMSWRRYGAAALIFNLFGLLAAYGLQRIQNLMPGIQPMPAVTPDSSFNTAVSFVTNTNWQGYSGEATMSFVTQMLALTVQNFLSAATGIAVLVALIRGIARRTSQTIGNFWVDTTRATLYILLPMSLVFALVLVSQGVMQTFDASKNVTLVQPIQESKGRFVTEQAIAMGPVASQIAIKQLGTNGGGYFNANSAHPFENPTPSQTSWNCSPSS
jgi:K+-transporting ATPase ATPase A chain